MLESPLRVELGAELFHGLNDFLRQKFPEAGWNEAARVVREFVEGFNAADAERVSVHWLAENQQTADGIGRDREFWVVNGFGQLVGWLMEDLAGTSAEVLLSTPVRRIEWQRGHVAVVTDGGTFERDRCAGDRSVGCAAGGNWGNRNTRVPSRGAGTSCRRWTTGDELGCANVTRCRDAFWARHRSSLSFLHHPEAAVPTRCRHRCSPAGPEDPRLRPSRVIRRRYVRTAALNTLAEALTMSRAEIERDITIHSHAGAYSYVPAGALDSYGYQRLTGTVHGALASGLRAARQILQRAG